MKFACIFDRFIIDNEGPVDIRDGFVINENDKSNERNVDHANGTSNQFSTMQNIIQRWDFFNKMKYDSGSSMNIYHAWETVLEDCKNGKELTGQYFKIQKQSIEMINCLCYRK